MSTIVIAPDSFKESLGAAEVAQTIAAGWHSVRPEDTLITHPMADGGEGTIAAILSVLGGEQRSTTVSGPFTDPIQAVWGWLPESRTAIIEMAQASGLHLVDPDARNPLTACTYGTGQLISAALDAGAKSIILTLGGSATNDAGAGMLKALGVQLFNMQQELLPAGGAALQELVHLQIDGLDQRIHDVQFTVACDVDNPLCGPKGASAIFGPQKGANAENIATLDSALDHFASICIHTQGTDHRNTPGAGAAGGMGFAALTFLNAQFQPGVELVAQITCLPQVLNGADLVITGEGRIDAQTLHGKTPMGVMRLARERQIPVLAMAGTLGEGYTNLYEHGLTAAFSLAPGPITLQQCQTQVRELLYQRAVDIAKMWAINRS